MLVLDTSAVVFLYIDSGAVGQADETRKTQEAVDRAEAIALSVLVAPEAASAFSRLQEDGKLTEAQAREAFKLLLEDWPQANQIEVTTQLALEASALARSRGLRGADAVHLASAAMLSRHTTGVRFLSFDERLNAAARGLVKLWEE